jgi:hypothetical protein
MIEVDDRADRQELLLFAKAIGTCARPRREGPPNPKWPPAAYALTGRFGHVYATGLNGSRQFQLCIGSHFDGETTRSKWLAIKKRLPFCRLAQDAQTDGTLFLDRLPTQKEALVLRACLGMKQARTYSAETLDKLREGMRRARESLQAGGGSERDRSPSQPKPLAA